MITAQRAFKRGALIRDHATRKVKTMNREQWLNRVAKSLEPRFKANGATLPAYRVTCGFPSRGAFATSKRVIGQCHYAEASGDGTHELIVSMTQDDPIEVAQVLCHEMIHAAIGTEAGHKKPFKDLALAMGLEGKMTATVAGQDFIDYMTPRLAKIGDYPHAKVDGSLRKKQSTRLIKCECRGCGYVVRTTAKWIAEGAPLCPSCLDKSGNNMQMSID